MSAAPLRPSHDALVERFLKQVYRYWHGHGFQNVVAQRVADAVTAAFLTLLPFVVVGVDWAGLFAECGSQAGAGESCRPLEAYIQPSRIGRPSSFIEVVGLMYVLVGCAFTAIQLHRAVVDIAAARETAAFARAALNIAGDGVLNSLSWDDVVRRLNIAVAQQVAPTLPMTPAGAVTIMPTQTPRTSPPQEAGSGAGLRSYQQQEQQLPAASFRSGTSGGHGGAGGGKGIHWRAYEALCARFRAELEDARRRMEAEVQRQQQQVQQRRAASAGGVGVGGGGSGVGAASGAAAGSERRQHHRQRQQRVRAATAVAPSDASSGLGPPPPSAGAAAARLPTSPPLAPQQAAPTGLSLSPSAAAAAAAARQQALASAAAAAASAGELGGHMDVSSPFLRPSLPVPSPAAAPVAAGGSPPASTLPAPATTVTPPGGATTIVHRSVQRVRADSETMLAGGAPGATSSAGASVRSSPVLSALRGPPAPLGGLTSPTMPVGQGTPPLHPAVPARTTSSDPAGMASSIGMARSNLVPHSHTGTGSSSPGASGGVAAAPRSPSLSPAMIDALTAPAPGAAPSPLGPSATSVLSPSAPRSAAAAGGLGLSSATTSVPSYALPSLDLGPPLASSSLSAGGSSGGATAGGAAPVSGAAAPAPGVVVRSGTTASPRLRAMSGGSATNALLPFATSVSRKQSRGSIGSAGATGSATPSAPASPAMVPLTDGGSGPGVAVPPTSPPLQPVFEHAAALATAAASAAGKHPEVVDDEAATVPASAGQQLQMLQLAAAAAEMSASAASSGIHASSSSPSAVPSAMPTAAAAASSVSSGGGSPLHAAASSSPAATAGALQTHHYVHAPHSLPTSVAAAAPRSPLPPIAPHTGGHGLATHGHHSPLPLLPAHTHSSPAVPSLRPYHHHHHHPHSSLPFAAAASRASTPSAPSGKSSAHASPVPAAMPVSGSLGGPTATAAAITHADDVRVDVAPSQPAAASLVHDASGHGALLSMPSLSLGSPAQPTAAAVGGTTAGARDALAATAARAAVASAEPPASAAGSLHAPSSYAQGHGFDDSEDDDDDTSSEASTSDGSSDDGAGDNRLMVTTAASGDHRPQQHDHLPVEQLFPLPADEVAARIMRFDNFMTYMVDSGMVDDLAVLVRPTQAQASERPDAGGRARAGSGGGRVLPAPYQSLRVGTERSPLLRHDALRAGGTTSTASAGASSALQPQYHSGSGGTVALELSPPLVTAPHTASLYWALRVVFVQPLVSSAIARPPGGRPAAAEPSAAAAAARTMRARALLIGGLGLLLSPFTLLFTIIVYAAQQIGDAHASKDYVGPRKWTQYALRLFREYDELPHVFQRRIGPSYALAGQFLASRTSPVAETLASPLLVISGTLVGIVAIVALLNEAVALNALLWGRNLLWYGTVAGVAASLARSLGPAAVEQQASLHRGGGAPARQDELLADLALCTRYAPPAWFADETTRRGDTAHAAVASLFRYRILNWCEEMVGCVTTPLALLVGFPRVVDAWSTQLAAAIDATGKVGPRCRPPEQPIAATTVAPAVAVIATVIAPRAGVDRAAHVTGKMARSRLSLVAEHAGTGCSLSADEELEDAEGEDDDQRQPAARGGGRWPAGGSSQPMLAASRSWLGGSRFVSGSQVGKAAGATRWAPHASGRLGGDDSVRMAASAKLDSLALRASRPAAGATAAVVRGSAFPAR